MGDVEKGIVQSGDRDPSIPSDTLNSAPSSPTRSSTSSLWALISRSSRSAEPGSPAKRRNWPWTDTEKAVGPGGGFPDDTQRRQPVVRQLHFTPEGYPQLAAFLDSDDNFRVYRRFGFLHSRILLKKQEQLRQLEVALDARDKADAEAKRRCLISMEGYDSDRNAERRGLDKEIEMKLLEYDTLLQSALALAHCSRPSSSEYTSVENWINNEHPLVPSEESFVYRKEDLLTLRPGREHAWLDASIERLLRKIHCKFIQRIFASKETRKKSNGHEVYYTRERIEALVVTVIVAMILALLVLPVYVLYVLTNKADGAQQNASCMGILLVATLLFAMCISLFTRAERHEILAASAAYCAVLVVFISNIGVVSIQSIQDG